MLLALSIVSEQGAALGPTAYKVFDERGGTIGRVAGNDWVLPDAQNFVSSRHALVTANGGVFYLEDKSSNGTFINSADRPVSRSDPQPLSDGDRLFIGDYEIIVQLIPSAPADIGARTVVGAVPPAGLATVDPLAALGREAAPAAAPPPDSATHRQFEDVARLAVQGLLEVLRSRTQVKNSFRLPGTSIKPVENNPLKFAPTAADAFHKLFVRRNPGDLDPVEAFREGFDDVTFHQTAVLAGIRAGFNALLAAFHPQTLEEIYERKRKRTAMLPLGNNKTKYWEMYCAQFEEIDRDREAHFQLLFGEEFARAYNEHLQKLVADARLRRQR
ncbi:MAG TPA: type VI secretion system-associated FHA domain protein TagH [Steroidobacteraceae bacterium]